MNIQKVGFVSQNYQIFHKQCAKQTNQQTQYNHTYNPIVYRDYNISFSGRTPEDFYAQDFNRDKMPSTMKDYLCYDYENRQHIPPEQMMREVFKYIEIADNFSDVKSIYPNEELFADLHENCKKSRKDILSEIDTVRDLSDAPLLKNGDDNFGMYLLKKIYLDGKTLKEINKDFYEKDINDEYKGIVTEPVKYSTLEAYGINYPDNSFWHSFIHTRDEYKKFFVTLPKDSVIPGVNITNRSNTQSDAGATVPKTDKPKTYKRRFSIKKYKKNEIERDLITKKCTDIEFVKKTVRKRFGKDDPEASFIVRYLSPIMTVASDRAHMSQEIKGFAEYEKIARKSPDADTLFGRFWKNNPKMLEVFSHAITDTMDMFEDIYGEGGMIPINTDLEEITPNTENKKIIDFVSPEFLELLSYSKDIDVLRSEKYILHDKLQKQWNEHFINRYGVPVSATEIASQKINVAKPAELSVEERLRIESEKDDSNVYKLHTSDGNYVFITSDVDDVLRRQINDLAKFFPSKYAQKYLKSTSAQDFSDNFKLTLAVSNMNQDLPEEQQIDFDDEKLQTKEEFKDEFYKLVQYNYDNPGAERAARYALIDTMQSIRDINFQDLHIYDMNISSIDESIVTEDSSKEEFNSVLILNKKDIDRRFDSYSTPLTSTEMNKVMKVFFDMLSKYDPRKTILDDRDSIVMISMLKDAMLSERNYMSCDAYFRALFKNDTFVKTLLSKGMSDDMMHAKFESIMDYLSLVIFATISNGPDIMALFNSDIYGKYRNSFSPETRKILDDALTKLSPVGRLAFFPEVSDLSAKRTLLNFNPGLINN